MTSRENEAKVAESREDEGKRVSAIEAEAEIVQAQQPLGTKDAELGLGVSSEKKEDAGVRDEEEEQQQQQREGGNGKLPFSRARCVALVSTVTGAAFLNTLGIQASVIILPTIGHHLSIPDSRQQWIISAYNLTFGCFLLLWGRLADVYGKRLIFIWGSAWVTVISILLPFIPNEIGFDVFRGLQGLGSAAMVPTAIGILGVTFPPGQARNYAFSCYGAGAPLGGIFGNIFGGVLAQFLDWRWVFWIFGILAAVCTVAGICVIPLPPPPTTTTTQAQSTAMRKTVDWIGGAIITVGLVILLFALSEGNVVGWKTPWVPTLIAVSISLIVAFGFWQYHLETKTAKRPLMKMSMFRNVKFSAANVIMMLFFSSFNNFLIFATYWFQDYQGLSVIQTTLRFIPNGVMGVTAVFITSQLVSRVRATYILTGSTICVFMSSLLFAIPIPTTTSYFAYGFPAMILSVCGADTLFPTLTLFVAKSLPSEDQALGGALINAVSQIGRALGLAIATAIQTAVMARDKGVSVDTIGSGEGGTEVGAWDEALKSGIRASCWFNAGLGILALGVVLVFFRGAGVVGGKKTKN